MSNINDFISELLSESIMSKVGKHIVKHRNHYLAGIAAVGAYGAARSIGNHIRNEREAKINSDRKHAHTIKTLRAQIKKHDAAINKTYNDAMRSPVEDYYK